MITRSLAAMTLLAVLTSCGGGSAGSPTVSASSAGPLGSATTTRGVDPDEIAIGADDFDVVMVDPGVGDLQLPLRQTQRGELDKLGFIAEWGPDAFDFDDRLAVSFNIPS